ncbi:MAG: hypothetical protein FJX72_19830, partial [Armatimonadetes bacterium]|nr:hypothetical protein [Armatimonadota bacterium]
GDRAPGNEPQPEVIIEVPEPPDGLLDAGRKTWERLAPELVKIGLLTVADLEAFFGLCMHWGMAQELCDTILSHVDPKTKRRRQRSIAEYLKEEPKKKGARGATLFAKLAVIDRWRAEEAAAFRIMAHFGMTPASRAKLNIGHAEKAEPSVIARMMNET